MSRRFFLSVSVQLVMLAVLLWSSYAWPIDHEELARIIKALPPNGPFWQYGNVVMRRKAKRAGMDPVVFIHWSHRARYTCRVCHQELGFSMRSGDTGITRAQYTAGKYCGACHNGKIAFTVQDGNPSQCGKCHLKDMGPVEEEFDTFAAALPIASFGNGIDWESVVGKGLVKPRNSLLTPRFTMPLPEKLRKPIRLGTTSPRSDVTFSHEEHFAELDCSSCHPDIFNIKKKGTESFSMERNIYGNFCGACHMRVAFPMNDCRRCHPQMGNFSGF